MDGVTDTCTEANALGLDEVLKNRRQTQPWQQEAMICFDGGGIRGYASLKILERLMAMIDEHEVAMDRERDGELLLRRQLGCSYNPAHYFDYLYGTSTGGLISIMLGRLRMSTGDALEKYRLISKEVFHKDLRQWGWQLKLLTKYPAHKIESVIRSIVRERTPEKSREIEKTVFSQMPSPSDLCKVGVVTYKKWTLLRNAITNTDVDTAQGGQAPLLFRTYKPHIDPDAPANSQFQLMGHQLLGEAGDISIVQACRATSAAPTYFPRAKIDMQIDGETVTREFIDGGTGTNNPTHRAWKEVESQIRLGGQRQCRCPLIVSIGTGKPKTSKLTSMLPSKLLPRIIRRSITDTEATHRLMQGEVIDPDHPNRAIDAGHYFRFNVRGLEDVGLDDLETCGEDTIEVMDSVIKHAFDPALGNQAERAEKTTMLDDMKKLARKLVKNRRMRAAAVADQEKAYWERFSKCTMYRCPKISEPPKFDSHERFKRLFSNREELRLHLKKHKGLSDGVKNEWVFLPRFEPHGPW